MTASTRIRLAVASAAGLALIGLGGSAVAHWTAGGTGTGTAPTGTATAVTLTNGTPPQGLYPGARADVTLVATNSSATTVTIGSLTLDTAQGTGGFGVDSDHAGCDVSALSFTTQTNGGAGWTVPPRAATVDGTLAITLPQAVAMSVDAANACQGASFVVYLAAGS